MNEQTKQKTIENRISETGENSLERRRRLLKAGIGAAPILMSLSSRSVYACLTPGKTTRPSGFCSMKVGTSSPGGGGKCPVSGKSPTTWCQQVNTMQKVQHGWPSSCYPKDYPKTYAYPKTIATKCGSLFGSGTAHADHTCFDVMAGTAPGTNEFHQWCVAARLNARANLTPVVCTEADVQAMWIGCTTVGYYEPSAGQQWSMADCLAYLKSTCTS